jgi:hypothetical protein
MTTTPMLDVLHFLAPAQWQTQSLGGEYDIITPVDPAVGVGQWKHVKNPQGWPWDIHLYDNRYIYDFVTEVSWEAGPRAYKKFIQNHTGPTIGILKDGLIMFPRYVQSNSNLFDLDIEPELTQYATFKDCTQVGPAQSLGLVHQRLRGPFQIDSGGDVGSQPTLIHQYYWSNNGVPTLEENHFALNYGWTQWNLLELDSSTGLYRLKQSTTRNTLAPAVPTINFPCF